MYTFAWETFQRHFTESRPVLFVQQKAQVSAENRNYSLKSLLKRFKLALPQNR